MTSQFRRTLLCGAILASFSVAGLAQDQDRGPRQQDPTAGDPVEVVRTIPSETSEDDPDLPGFLKGMVDKSEYLRLRGQFTRKLRGNPERLPYDPRALALQRLRELGAVPSGARPELSTQAWTFVGPNPTPNGQTTTRSDPVSGRTIEIVVHPTNENIVYVGAAQGGLYRSLNGGVTWTQLLDEADSQAVNAIAFHPTDPTTLFVGTGEAGFSGDSFFGVGIYRILNADSASPTVEGPFGSTEFRNRSVSNLVATMSGGNVVLFVSSSSGGGGYDASLGSPLPARGLYRSVDAMAATPSFTKLTGLAGGANLPVMDMVFDPTDNNTLVCSVFGIDSISAGQGGIWRTTNALAGTPTFTRTLALSQQIRVELAAQNSSGTVTMLAATGEPGQNVSGTNCTSAQGQLRRSTDKGATWSTAILGQTNGFCGGQCSYDIAVAMKPDNANVVLLGGAANDTAAAQCSDVLTKSTNGSTFARSDTGLHADTHALAFAPSNPNIAFVGNDGGIWKSLDAGTSWTSLNNATYSATQFQSIALHATSGDFMIGGTQDNGTQMIQFDGSWRRTDYGDGGFARIDQSDTGTSVVRMYHTYFNIAGQLMAFATTESPSAFENWSCMGCGGMSCANTPTKIACTDSAVLFYAPIEVGPGTPNTFYYGSDRIYRTADEGATVSPVSQQFQSGVAVSSIGISPQNDAVRIVGLENGRIFKTTTGANPLTEATPTITGTPTSTYVTDVVVDPNNVNTAYAAFSGFGYTTPTQHLWKTTNLNNATPTWTAIWSIGIDVPVNSVVVNPYDSNVVYAGTDIGVFRSTDAGANWAVYGTSLPNVAVFDMAYHRPTAKLRIATHGRGIWEIQDCPSAVTITNVSPTSGGPGTSVTITGTGFTNVTSVRFGTGSASFTVNSTTSITAAVPDSATSGFVEVSTFCASAASAFTVPPCAGAPTFGGSTTVAASGCGLQASWAAATPACGTVTYDVHRSTTSGFTPSAANRIAQGVTGTSYVDTSALTPGTTYYYLIRAVDGATLQATSNGQGSAAAPATGSIPTTTFSDDFEGSPTPPGHTFGVSRIDGDATNSWLILNGGLAHNGTRAGRFGDTAGTTYANCQDERLIAGGVGTGINLSGVSSPVTVKFWLWYDIEPPTGTTGWDGLRLEYSTDNGASWAIVPDVDPGSGPYITSHPYHSTATLVAISAPGCTPTVRSSRPSGSKIWTGSSGGWVEVSADFSRFAGTANPILLGFRMMSDQLSAAKGVYIDEIRVISTTTGSCTAGPTSSPAFTARTTWGGTDFSGQVKLEWRNPSSSNGSLRIRRKAGSCPSSATDGTLVLSTDNPVASAYGTQTDSGVPAGRQCYALYYFTGTGGSGTASSPLTTTAWVDNRLGTGSGKSAWVYATNASSLSPPGMFSGSAFMTSNDRYLHGVNPGTTGGDWIGTGSKTWTPAAMNGPAQSRPLVVPLNTNPVGGANRVSFMGSQDGRIYAFNATTGAELWATTVLADGFIGTASLAAREYGISLTGVDLVLLGTRNPGAANKLMARVAADGSAAWEFDNGGGASAIGVINGSVSIDYANKRAYFASRANASGSSDTVWCVSFTESGASKVWSAALGDVDGTPVLWGGRIYVGTNTGRLYALDPVTGATQWFYDTSDGFVKGFAFRDSSGRLFFSTNNKVWGLQDNGASATKIWDVAIPSPSPAILYNGAVYAGGGDGNLHRITNVGVATPTVTQVQIGDGNSIVGSPGFDSSGLAYVGTDAGDFFEVTLP